MSLLVVDAVEVNSYVNNYNSVILNTILISLGKHKNSLQEDALIQFMENHSDIARGFTKCNKLDVENLWIDLTTNLNSFGPPIHDTNGWKKVWRDWKACTKKKITTNKKEAIATGGGPHNQIYISKKEEIIGQLCGLYSLADGVQNSISIIGSDLLSSDDEITPTSRPDKRKVEDDITCDKPSTSKRASKRNDEDVKESLKGYIQDDIKNGKELSDSFKMLVEVCQKSDDKLHIIGSNTRRVYKSIENLTTNITNEIKRHNQQMEKAAFEKNNLKKMDLEIKEKQLELELLKYQKK
ncbi:uncharacterized protein LOC135949807 [Calliphora vicina]|uniref:uncharacterized protein LOC135949807 n=1 Tax=Calliphora vicina TaxID=7373 RepID=UPI00325AD6FF